MVLLIIETLILPPLRRFPEEGQDDSRRDGVTDVTCLGSVTGTDGLEERGTTEP